MTLIGRTLLRPGAAARRSRQGEEGAAAVEMAIVLPLLLLTIFGLVDFGRVMQQQIQLTEAVREAARVGALNGTTADMQAQVTSTVGAGVPLTYSAVAACTASSGSGTNATMTVSRTFVPATPLFSVMALFGTTGNTTITLSATGLQACLG
jgi:Flp pilus assembly protein TadG